MSPEALIHLAIDAAGTLLTVGMVWGVVKTELRWHRKDIDTAQERADDAHKRIDGILEHKA